MSIARSVLRLADEVVHAHPTNLQGMLSAHREGTLAGHAYLYVDTYNINIKKRCLNSYNIKMFTKTFMASRTNGMRSHSNG